MPSTITTPAAPEFAIRGRRTKPGFGLHYASACGRYEIYKSDQVGGVPVKPARWLAISFVGGRKVLSRHKTRTAAAIACVKHARGASRK
jgi:hypothetical protein